MRGIALIAAVLCTVLTAVFAVGAFLEHSAAESKVDDAEQHESAASLFRQAEGEAQAAGTALQEFIATGDATKIQEINERTSSGVTLLTAAVQEAGIDGTPLLEGGSALVQAEGQIIALRQAGDVQGAIAGLTALQTQFEEFQATQNGIIENQETLAAEARDDAETADGLTQWMVIAGAVFAIGAVFSGIVYIRQNTSRRRSVGGVAPA